QHQIESRLARPQGKDSRANYLRKSLGLSPMEANLLRETGTPPDRLKSMAVTLTGPQPLTRAISTAGGISFDALDDILMLKALPGTYAIGEMLDWEAPTGGYLLQACFSTAVFAPRAILNRIARSRISLSRFPRAIGFLRQTGAPSPTVNAAYQYDPLGRRTRKSGVGVRGR